MLSSIQPTEYSQKTGSNSESKSSEVYETKERKTYPKCVGDMSPTEYENHQRDKRNADRVLMKQYRELEEKVENNLSTEQMIVNMKKEHTAKMFEYDVRMGEHTAKIKKYIKLVRVYTTWVEEQNYKMEEIDDEIVEVKQKFDQIPMLNEKCEKIIKFEKRIDELEYQLKRSNSSFFKEMVFIYIFIVVTYYYTYKDILDHFLK